MFFMPFLVVYITCAWALKYAGWLELLTHIWHEMQDCSCILYRNVADNQDDDNDGGGAIRRAFLSLIVVMILLAL